MKAELTKENWDALTDDEKTIEMRKLIPGFDYKKERQTYEKLKEMGLENNLVFDNPCLTLKLIDPVIARSLSSWLYEPGEKLQNIPVFGYRLDKITFDESTLMGFNDSEKSILLQAMEIIKNKIN